MTLSELHNRLEVHKSYLRELESEYYNILKTQSYHKFKDKYLAAIEDYEKRITLYGSGIDIIAMKGEGYLDNNIMVEAICFYSGISADEAKQLFLLDNPNFTLTEIKHITSRHTIYKPKINGK